MYMYVCMCVYMCPCLCKCQYVCIHMYILEADTVFSLSDTVFSLSDTVCSSDTISRAILLKRSKLLICSLKIILVAYLNTYGA